MDAADDTTAKARFYLENRAAIEEWAALREEGRALLERELLQAETRLRELSEAAGATAWVEPDRGYPLLLARRQEWRKGAVEISVGIGWDHGKLLRPGFGEWPWVGVYLDGYDSPAGKRVRERLRTFPDVRAYSKDVPWVLWRYVPADPGPSLDAAALAATVLEQAERLFDDVHVHLGPEPFAG